MRREEVTIRATGVRLEEAAGEADPSWGPERRAEVEAWRRIELDPALREKLTLR